MQEQNFEEEVRRKMAELAFVPTDPVWEKVEKEIRNKKERRRIFFWLLPLLVIPGLVYYFMHAGDSSVLNGTAVTTPATEEQVPSNPRQDRPTTQLPHPVKEAGIASPIPKSNTYETVSKSKLPAPSLTYTGTKDDDNNITKRSKRETNNAHETWVQGKLKIAEETGTNNLSQQIINKAPSDANVPLKENIDSATKEADSSRINKVPVDSLLVPLTDTTSAREIVQHKKVAKKRWNLSFNTSLGVAGISTSTLPIFNGGKSVVYQNLAFDNGLAASASTNVPRSNLRSVVLRDDPSKVRRNVGFSAGIGLNKKIKNRFGLSTGLQYTQISTLTSVGRKVESVSSQPRDFYLNTNLATKDYVTRYHIVELPLSFNWQVMPKTPLTLQAGISVGYLLSTNALQYDGAMNIYYLDKSLYKPAQLSALTGFEYTITKKSKHAFTIGPKLQFQLSNLLKNKTNGQQHLYFAGIGSSFSL